jgi:O-antigen/teichoic acid export membrane protein
LPDNVNQAQTGRGKMGVIQRQGIKNTISSYLGIILGFVSLIIIQPRFLKVDEIGLVRFLFACSTLLASFIPLGVANMTIKYFPVFKDPKSGHHGFFGFMMIFPLVGFLLTIAGMLVFKEFFIAQYRRESPLFVEYFNYIFPFSLFIAFSTVITYYLISLFKTTIPSYLNDIYVRLAYMGLIILYYFKVVTLPQFISLYVGVFALQLLLLIAYLFKVDTPSLKVEWDFFKKANIKEMVVFALLLSVSSIASLGLKTLDSVLLGKFFAPAVVGIYAIVSFIPTIIETPLNALDRIVTAKVAHSVVENDISEIRNVFYKSVKYLSVIGALLFIGINTNIEFLLRLVGKDYAQGAHVVWIISLGSLINMMGGANGAILIYSSKHWQVAILLMSLVILSFAGNMLLVPIFGMEGAAMATAGSVSLYTLLRLFFVYRKFGFQPYDWNIVKLIGIALFCLAINYFLPVLRSDIVNILLRSAVLGGTFLSLVYLAKIVPEFHSYLPWHKN